MLRTRSSADLLLRRGRGFVLLVAVSLTTALLAVRLPAEPNPTAIPAQERLRPAGIDGALVLCGGGKVPDAARQRFVELAGGPKAHVVIVSIIGQATDRAEAEDVPAPWKALKPAAVVVVQGTAREIATDDRFAESLREATGVWFDGGNQKPRVSLGTAVGKELTALLRRGGVVGGTADGAEFLSPVLGLARYSAPRTVPEFDLLPDTVIKPHFMQVGHKDPLFGALDRNAGLLGLGIDETAALVIHGREIRVLGTGTVTACLTPTPARPERMIELKKGTAADLTQLRRAARARAEPPYPPKVAPVPEVAHGTLVIVGGGGMPAEVTRKFIELAGGPDALIVVLPTAQPDPIKPIAASGFFRKAGAKNVQELPGRELKDVEDPKNLDLLRRAGGIWFGGGRQWRFVDAYEGTKAHELFRDVLRRGGVLGGSSAGASIQGDYLCRGSPKGPNEMMCEGYERALGFLPGVAIDQHFTQRKRQPDMTALMKTYPQFLGIGIDETTALLVRGHVAEIVGRGNVYFYDRHKSLEPGKPDYEIVKAGGRYDLKARKILESGGAK